MRDAADAAGQSDPVRNPQFRRRWSDRTSKPTRRAVDAALAMFAPVHMTGPTEPQPDADNNDTAER